MIPKGIPDPRSTSFVIRRSPSLAALYLAATRTALRVVSERRLLGHSSVIVETADEYPLLPLATRLLSAQVCCIYAVAHPFPAACLVMQHCRLVLFATSYIYIYIYIYMTLYIYIYIYVYNEYIHYNYSHMSALGLTQAQVAAQGNPETADRRQNGPGRANRTSKRTQNSPERATARASPWATRMTA